MFLVVPFIKKFPHMPAFSAFQIKSQATNGFQAFIVHYRDDPDQQNLIDWIQEKWVSIANKNKK